MIRETPPETTILILVIAIPTILFLLAFICNSYGDFRRELKYINLEIGRTYGEEREDWKRKRRRLWLSLLPFVKY